MSFKYRIAVTIFTLEAILIALVLWGTLRYTTDHVRNQAARNDQITIRLLKDLSRTAFVSGEFAELQTFIESSRQNPRIRAVVVVDLDNDVVAATDAALIGSQRPAPPNGDGSRWRSVDVQSRVGQAGTLAIEFSDGPIENAYQRLEREARTVIVGVLPCRIHPCGQA
jgi:hypothetical protein